MNKILRIFVGVDFRCQHNGLWEHVTRHRCKTTLTSGEHYFFLNRKMTALKVLSGSGVMSYAKLENVASQDDLQIFARAWCASEVTLGSREKLVLRAKKAEKSA